MNLTQVKSIVKKRYEHFQKLQRNVQLSDLYEIASWEAGFKDWNVYSAFLKEESSPQDLDKYNPRLDELVEMLGRMGWKLAAGTYNRWAPESELGFELYEGLRHLHPEINPFTYPDSDETHGSFPYFDAWHDKSPDATVKNILKGLNECSKCQGVWFPEYADDNYEGEMLHFFKGHSESSLTALIESYGSDHLVEVGKKAIEASREEQGRKVMDETLDILVNTGLIEKVDVDGKDHVRLTPGACEMMDAGLIPRIEEADGVDGK